MHSRYSDLSQQEKYNCHLPFVHLGTQVKLQFTGMSVHTHVVAYRRFSNINNHLELVLDYSVSDMNVDANRLQSMKHAITQTLFAISTVSR